MFNPIGGRKSPRRECLIRLEKGNRRRGVLPYARIRVSVMEKMFNLIGERKSPRRECLIRLEKGNRRRGVLSYARIRVFVREEIP